MNKKNEPAPALTVVAHPLLPTAAALTWLQQAQAQGLTFRVPLEVAVSPLGVGSGHLGFAADRIAVNINDTALGIGLADRARTWCGATATTCAMWVWGQWQDGTLVVTKAEGAIDAAGKPFATNIHISK
ncbi:MAG: hypothetical protein KBG15_16225 [Kofleriaceae bacterium]|nr:hypothetical protein [Kofleriaceae bacterium]